MSIELKNIVEICVALDIAIIGIALPLLVQEESKIGGKYNSTYLKKVFSFEFPANNITIQFFKNKLITVKSIIFVIVLTLLSFLLLIFNFSSPIGWDCWFINNSAKLIVFGLSVFLVVTFLLWVQILLNYNGNTTKLFNYLQKKSNDYRKNPEKRKYVFKAINEFTVLAVKNQDSHLQEVILTYYYKLISQLRREYYESKNNNPYSYPIELYEMVNQIVFIASRNENEKLKAVEHRAVSGYWLFGEDNLEIEISNETYYWLWQNIMAIHESKRLVKMYWENANQYFDFRLDFNYTIYDDKEKVNKREKERDRFIEFHLAIGGLLIYKKAYITLIDILDYSRSNSVPQPLLPSNMRDIFKWYNTFSYYFENTGSHIEQRYYYPETDNLTKIHSVDYYVRLFIVLLFLRQFTLPSKYPDYYGFIKQPNLPDEIPKLFEWLRSVKSFTEYANYVVKENLHSELNLSRVLNNNISEINQFLSDLENRIIEEIKDLRFNKGLSDTRIERLKAKTSELLVASFDRYKPLFQEYDCLEKMLKSDKYYHASIKGALLNIPRPALLDNDIPYEGYEPLLANLIIEKQIKFYIPNIIKAQVQIGYLLRREEVVDGIKRIINKNNDLVIIGCNLIDNIKHMLSSVITSNKIIRIESTNRKLENTIFIMSKNDLPCINFLEIPENDKTKYNIDEPINDDKKIYFYLKDADVKDIKSDNPDELEKIEIWAVAGAFLNAVVSIKKAAKVIQVNVYTEYREQGVVNSLDEVKSYR